MIFLLVLLIPSSVLGVLPSSSPLSSSLSSSSIPLSKKIASMLLKNNNVSRYIPVPNNCLFLRCSINNEDDEYDNNLVKSIFELNPNYQHQQQQEEEDKNPHCTNDNEEDEDYSDDDEDDDDEEEDDKEFYHKSDHDDEDGTLRTALVRKSRKQRKSMRSKSISDNVMKTKIKKTMVLQSLTSPIGSIGYWLKKHRTVLLLGCSLFAFRKEIQYYAIRHLPGTTHPIDKMTGKILGWKMEINPTAIVKIIVFIELMRRFISIRKRFISIQKFNNTENDYYDNIDDDIQQSESTHLLSGPLLASLLLGTMGGRNDGPIGKFLALLLVRILSGSANRMINMAYIPPIEQHYTFERVNERYQKDHLAYLKVTGGINRIATTSSSTGSLTEVLAPTATNATDDTITANNDTIVETESGNNAINGSSVTEQNTYRKPKRVSLLQLLSSSLLGIQSSRTNDEMLTISKRPPYNGTVIILDWTGLDSSIQSMDVLRDKVSFIIHEYNNNHNTLTTATTTTTTESTSSSSPALFEVVVLLESPGGSASDYALASSQLLRMRNIGIPITICVDKVAASGGYMIACAASPGKLLAAPFAVVGSIGVIGQTINIQKTLEGWGIRPIVFRGGKNKAPVGLLGDITDAGIQKIQSIVDETHQAFKRYVVEARPQLASCIDDIATGDVWLGYDALNVGLIDRIVTSDEYIYERIVHDNARVVELVQLIRPKFPFARPTTATRLVSSSSSSVGTGKSTSTTAAVAELMVPILTDLRKLLEKATTMIVPPITG